MPSSQTPARPTPTPVTPRITPAPNPINKPTDKPSDFMTAAFEKIRSFAKGLIPSGETAPAQAGRKGADLDEMQKKADEIAYGK